MKKRGPPKLNGELLKSKAEKLLGFQVAKRLRSFALILDEILPICRWRTLATPMNSKFNRTSITRLTTIDGPTAVRGFAQKLPRLCRLMCGRPLAFRYAVFSISGYAQFVGAKPKIHCEPERKRRALPHIRRQSR